MDKQFLVVEKIERGHAFCEDSAKNIIMIPLLNLPPNIKENDCIRILEKGYIIDEELTLNRKKNITNLSKTLFK